jgi:two-component system sensor histidine kinase UhpB
MNRPSRPDDLRGIATRPPAELFPRVRGLFGALWHRRSIRAQLLLSFIVLDLIAASIAGAIIIWQARASTRLEIAASMQLAERLASETLRRAQQDGSVQDLMSRLPSPLQALRHVRIHMVDADDKEAMAPASRISAPWTDPRTPAWFAAMIAPPPRRHELPVMTGGRTVGTLVIVGEPSDEIAEVWENTLALAAVALVGHLALIGALYVIFGHLLRPLAGVAGGMRDLERHNYTVRLKPPRTRELLAITERFNALAAALGAARAENIRLSRRVITAQDDERRRVALELHDEVGPSLFGLKASAGSIALVLGKARTATAGKIAERLREMQTIIDHLQGLNRRMLNRLRPMALGHLPLGELLSEMVQERARQQPDLAFALRAGRLRDSYGDSVDLTIYRCVQEGLTNALRHADAKRVDIDIGECPGEGGFSLTLTIRDDGRGIEPNARPGFGLTGMQERVHALGGEHALESLAGRGTCVRITIPVRVQTAENRERAEPNGGPP